MKMATFNLANAIRKAWPILIEAARMGRTLTYSELAGRAGPPLNRRQIHRQLLSPLSARCRRAGLPDLSALVVRKDTGKPGGGWFDPERPTDADEAAWVDALSDCFRHRWDLRPDPALLEDPPIPPVDRPAPTNPGGDPGVFP
ncbi:MAG: hypothetical protein U0800_08920 [Isosphaeraceae bacterium]